MEKTCVNKEKGNNTDLCKLRQCINCKNKDKRPTTRVDGF